MNQNGRRVHQSFSPTGSNIVLVFWVQRALRYADDNPLSRAAALNTARMRKMCVFDKRQLPGISKTIRDRITIEKLYVPAATVSLSMTLSDLEKLDLNFWGGATSVFVPFDRELVAKFGKVTDVGRGVLLSVNYQPRDPALPSFGRPPYVRSVKKSM